MRADEKEKAFRADRIDSGCPPVNFGSQPRSPRVPKKVQIRCRAAPRNFGNGAPQHNFSRRMTFLASNDPEGRGIGLAPQSSTREGNYVILKNAGRVLQLA
jgi:hypothetical protein